MNKNKAVFVALLIAAMLALIMLGCYRLGYRAWIVIAALFAVYGYLCATRGFAGWLSKEPPLLPPKHEELWTPDESFTQNYDQILEEFKEEGRKYDSLEK